MLDWLVEFRVLNAISILYQIYCSGQCTYQCFLKISLTNTRHNILPMALAAFQNNYHDYYWWQLLLLSNHRKEIVWNGHSNASDPYWIFSNQPGFPTSKALFCTTASIDGRHTVFAPSVCPLQCLSVTLLLYLSANKNFNNDHNHNFFNSNW